MWLQAELALDAAGRRGSTGRVRPDLLGALFLTPEPQSTVRKANCCLVTLLLGEGSTARAG